MPNYFSKYALSLVSVQGNNPSCIVLGHAFNYVVSDNIKQALLRIWRFLGIKLRKVFLGERLPCRLSELNAFFGLSHARLR